MKKSKAVPSREIVSKSKAPGAARPSAAAPRGSATAKAKPGRSALPPLESLRARDLMSDDLVTVFADTPVEDILARFDEYAISALPVVDELGAPLGIVTKADVARVERMRDDKLEGRPGDSRYGERDEDDAADFPVREDYSPEVLGRALASDWMHPATVYVSPDATLGELCRLMIKERIHHLAVLMGGKVVGMISSLDVVRAAGERC